MKKPLLLKVLSVICVSMLICSGVYASQSLKGVNAEELPTPTMSLNYSNGTFSAGTNYTVTTSGTGIVASSEIMNSFNFSDTTSYLTITADSNTKFTSGTNGISFTYKQMSLADYTTNSHYEQVFTFEDANGNQAYICLGGLYYLPKGGSNTHVQAPSDFKKIVTTTPKDVAVTVSADKTTILVYLDGELMMKFLPTNDKADIIKNVATCVLDTLSKNGSSLHVRKPHPNKTQAGRNTTNLVMADLKVFDKTLTQEEVKSLMAANVTTPAYSPVITLDHLQSTQYQTITVGSGFGEANDSARVGAYALSDISSYVEIKPNADEALSADGKALSFHFWQRTNTNTFYSGNTSLRPNVTDDFEQLFSAEATNGDRAYLCSGGIYYLTAEQTSTYAQPRTGGNNALLNTEWKYVSIVLNSEEYSIHTYINGELVQIYDQSSPKKAIVQQVVELFSEATKTKGTSVYFRKPNPVKTNRNTATNLFDDLIISEGGLNAEQALAYYDNAVGVTRIKVVSNVNIEPFSLVGKVGEKINVNASEVEGYSFKGLYLDEQLNNPLEENAVFSNELTVLYAKYEPIAYNITYHLDGAVQNENNPVSYTLLNTGISIHPVEKAGYTFNGWYRTADFKNEFSYIVEGLSGDITLYAKFTPNVYSVTYILNGGLLMGAVKESYTIEDQPISLVNVWKPDYEFIGWYSDSEFTNKVESIDTLLATDITLYAKFAPTVFTVSFVAEGATHENTVTSYTVEDQAIVLLDAVKANYDFIGWYCDSEFTNKVERIDTQLATNLTLYAKFAPTAFTITYVAEGATHENANSYTVEDQAITLLDAVKEGYTFEGWYSDSEFTNKVESIDTQLATDLTLYAKFSAIEVQPDSSHVNSEEFLLTCSSSLGLGSSLFAIAISAIAFVIKKRGAKQ